MEQQTAIEIYIKDCPNDRLFAWIESAVGPLGNPEEIGDATLYPSPLGPVIITPNIQDGPFVGVEFIMPHSPWATDVDCGRQAARELGCIVRCDPGQHFPEVDPLSDAVLEINGYTERIEN